MVAGGTIKSSIENPGSSPPQAESDSTITLKKNRPVEPIRQEFSPSRMSDPNSTNDARRGGILRRRSEVGNEGGAEPPRPGRGGFRRGALNLLISNNQ
jgi:hypothetical protein